ncbi:arylsulfatase [Aquisediminimonas sediminicola]|uniref:arylsulfatase n=1 Tax=Alteraquisediminimonas sediminicola TaxID=2676787 RepID=UPI001FE3DE88|nr:arylsulfatase [Aquisediminimonas sediminicola]
MAPKNAPNVLLIMTDDVGFGASSTFGGAIPTPAFDELAAAGVRYNQFNTSALCSPTRAALLTGRNPQAVGMGNVTNNPTAYPGYTTIIPKSAATVATVLREGGYSTAMFGKGHITPDWEQSQAGPFDRWPTGLGFEYFYGFLNADANQFAPALVRNTTPVDPATGKPGYVLDQDLANDAIRWIDEHKALAPNKPFFMYYAPGTAHTPHQAPKDWIDRFHGKFDQGWDKLREEIYLRQKRMGVIPANAQLSPRPSSLPAWDQCTPAQKKLYARYMEAYAGALAFADAQIGRIIQHLKDSGQFDNTLVIFIQGDNGASAEGGLDGLMYEQSALTRSPESFDYKLAHIDDIGTVNAYNHFPAPWAWAINSPFQWYKQVASHFGGTRNGMVMTWPGHIPAGGSLRSQFHYVTDIAPTILEATGIPAPAVVDGVPQQKIDGISMSYSFTQPKAPSHRREMVIELMQNLGVYKDGWFAGTTPGRVAWDTSKDVAVPVDQRNWELYHVAEDFSESHDLASKEPARLADMKALFWTRAAESKILPIHNSTIGVGAAGRPSLATGRDEFLYRSRIRRVPLDSGPNFYNRSFDIEASIVVPQAGASGAIIAAGGQFGGYTLALIDGRPVFGYNAVPPNISIVRADEQLTPGEHRVNVDFVYDGGGRGKGGTVTILADGRKIGEGRIEKTAPRWISHTEGLDIGADTTTPVIHDYASPAEFSGEIRWVKFRVK